MPLARLIFFPEPVELTEAQIEEARALGHLVEDPAGEASPPAPAPPYNPPPAALADDDQPEEG